MILQKDVSISSEVAWTVFIINFLNCSSIARVIVVSKHCAKRFLVRSIAVFVSALGEMMTELYWNLIKNGYRWTSQLMFVNYHFNVQIQLFLSSKHFAKFLNFERRIFVILCSFVMEQMFFVRRAKLQKTSSTATGKSFS